MAIHTIENITLDGKNQAYRGFIYSCKVQIGLINAPTSVELAFINEDGIFFEPELSATKPHKLSIGNILSGNVYPISWEKTETSSGRVLVVKYLDGSIILDRLFVGLYKRHGDENTNIDGLIIVGREVHPCDANEDGVFDQSDVSLIQANQEDPCELRCPHSEKWQDPIVKQCIEREIKEVLPIKYSFKDLLDAIQGTASQFSSSRSVSLPVDDGESLEISLPATQKNTNSNPRNRIKIGLIPNNINLQYLADFTGTLREVLGAWCAEFGWSFYWENDVLNFVDTKTRPKLKQRNYSFLAEKSSSKTIEGTINRGFVSNYLTPAIEAETSCSQSRPLLLRCLDLADLYGEYYKPIWSSVAITQSDLPSLVGASALNPPYPDPTDSASDNQIEYKDSLYPDGVPISSFEKSVVLSLYSENLRNLYILSNYYGIIDAQAAIDSKNKWLDRLGQMKILNVMDAEVSNEIYRNQYLNLLNGTLPNEGEDGTKPVKLISEEESADITSKKGFFIVAKCNTDLLKKQYEIEHRLASEFVGQHWLRAYTSPYYGEAPSITPNGQYFGALSTNVQDLPFTSFGHTYKSTVSQMVSAFVQKQRNSYRQHGHLRYFTAKNTAKKNVRSIVYFNRSNAQEVWNPLPNSETAIQALKTEVDNHIFKEIDISSLSKETKLSLTRDENGITLPESEAESIKLFVVFPYVVRVTPDSNSQDFVKNIKEEDPLHGEDVQPYKLVTYGLTDKKCVRYTVNGFPIYMPAGSSVLFDKQTRFRWKDREPETKEFSTPRYKVFVSTEITNRGIVPKTESLLISPPPSQEGIRTEYNIHEINQDSIRYIGQLSKDCVIDPQKLSIIHSKLSKYLNFSVNTPFESKTYSLFGLQIPEKIGILDGLESISVRVDDKGVFTDIVVGNSLFTPASPNYILKQLELSLGNKYINSQKNPI